TKYWGGLIEWLRDRVAGEGKIATEDLNLIHLTDDPADAVRWITKARERRTAAHAASTNNP
ncbi:MAG TPA: hypothetical protein VH113_05570, partial [Gemmatimonadales bacterium]|nr:hypothetical protein [Gemmatimonadales bacterium]